MSLGTLSRLDQLAILILRVVLLLTKGFVIKRLTSLDYPVWAPRPEPRSNLDDHRLP